MKSKRKYLIDTHCWLWWHINPEKLHQKAFKIIENRETTIYFSAVSAWEIVIKHNLKKLKLPMPPYEYISKRLEMSFMDVLPIQLEQVLQVQNLPDIHKDPFDRLLIAQAKTKESIVISEDQQFENYAIMLLP